MSHALELARRAEGRVSPNPPVGAVLVRDGEVIGRGYTQPPGQSHAEVLALREAGEAARGAALYTTLEPCSHHGRTPPCTDAIIEAGVAEVHAAVLDPNPNVRGGGLAILAEAGVSTRVGEGEAKARLLLEAYVKYVTTGTPFVTAKFAMSLDGKIATRIGDSKWISGEKARRRVHRLRAASDAVMVGIGHRACGRSAAHRPRQEGRAARKAAAPGRGRHPRSYAPRRADVGRAGADARRGGRPR